MQFSFSHRRVVFTVVILIIVGWISMRVLNLEDNYTVSGASEWGTIAVTISPLASKSSVAEMTPHPLSISPTDTKPSLSSPPTDSPVVPPPTDSPVVPPPTDSPVVPPTSPTLPPTLRPTHICELPFHETHDTASSHVRRPSWIPPGSDLLRVYDPKIMIGNVIFVAEGTYGQTCNQMVALIGLINEVIQLRVPGTRHVAFSREISQTILFLDLGYLTYGLNSLLLNCDQVGNDWDNEHYVHGSWQVKCDAYSPGEPLTDGTVARGFTAGIIGLVDQVIKQEAIFRRGGQVPMSQRPFVIPSLPLRREVQRVILETAHRGMLKRKNSILVAVHHRTFGPGCAEGLKGSCAKDPEIVCDYQLSEPQVTRIFERMPKLQVVTSSVTNASLFFSTDNVSVIHMQESNLDRRLKIGHTFSDLGVCLSKDRLGVGRDFLAILWAFAMSDVYFENPASTCGAFVFMWGKVFGSELRGEPHEPGLIYPPECFGYTNANLTS